MKDEMSGGDHDFTVSPTIGGWPYKSFKKFKKFAVEEAGDCYWMAIDKLMQDQEKLKIYEEMLGFGEEPEEPAEDDDEEDERLTLGDR